MYAYNRSKLYALMFVLEAADRWRDVSCLAIHPGNMVSVHRIEALATFTGYAGYPALGCL